MMTHQDLLDNYKKAFTIKLDEIRIKHDHRGIKGDKLELELRNLISEYISPLQQIGTGEIIDLNDNRSNQHDIVITNQYHPSLANKEEASLFIIEGVSSVGEVKANLSSGDLDTAIASCLKLKKMKCNIPIGTQINSSDSDIIRFIDRKPYFIFAFDSQITLEKIKTKLNDYYTSHSIPFFEQIDGVFILERGSIINYGDGNGALKYLANTTPKTSIPGYVNNKDDNALLTFMFWLTTISAHLIMFQSPLIPYLLKK